MSDPTADDRWSWWNARRPPFSAAVAGCYMVTALLHEAVAPAWVGDHIGLDAGTLVLYALGALVWTVGANGVFTLWPLAERISKPADVESFRKTAWRLGLGLGTASFPAFYAVIVLTSWPGRR
jgi:hypothetical protein